MSSLQASPQHSEACVQCLLSQPPACSLIRTSLRTALTGVGTVAIRVFKPQHYRQQTSEKPGTWEIQKKGSGMEEKERKEKGRVKLEKTYVI